MSVNMVNYCYYYLTTSCIVTIGLHNRVNVWCTVHPARGLELPMSFTKIDCYRNGISGGAEIFVPSKLLGLQ